MSPQSHHRFKETRLGKVCMALIMLLCLFVVVQMLGVPVTLLNPVEAADSLTVSVSEGFSIPSSIPQPTLAVNTDPVTDGQSSIHTPVLASTLFRPPVI
jgi:hypothetical protein